MTLENSYENLRPVIIRSFTDKARASLNMRNNFLFSYFLNETIGDLLGLGFVKILERSEKEIDLAFLRQGAGLTEVAIDTKNFPLNQPPLQKYKEDAYEIYSRDTHQRMIFDYAVSLIREGIEDFEVSLGLASQHALLAKLLQIKTGKDFYTQSARTLSRLYPEQMGVCAVDTTVGPIASDGKVEIYQCRHDIGDESVRVYPLILPHPFVWKIYALFKPP